MKNISFGVGKLCGRAAAEFGLFEEQMGLRVAKLAAELGDRGVKGRGIIGKFGEKCASLVAREPFDIGKFATRGSFAWAGAGRVGRTPKMMMESFHSFDA